MSNLGLHPCRTGVYSRLSKFLTALALALMVGACGDKGSVGDASELLRAQSAYCPLGSLEEIDLVEEALALEPSLILSGYYLALGRTLSAEVPLVLSYERLKKEFENFKAHPQGKPLSPELSTRWRQFKGDLLRWRDYQCSIDMLKRKNDIDIRLVSRPFEELGASDQREYALKLCRPFESDIYCEAGLVLYERRARTRTFFNRYQELYRERGMRKLFNIRPQNKLQFNCYPTNRGMVLELSLGVPSSWDETLKEKVKHYLEEIWSLDFELGLKVNFKRSSDAEVIVELTNRSLSFVRDGEFHLIRLSQDVARAQVPLVIAHELGHVLGMPDCYVEYYDPETDSIIYYEPGGEHGDNLMCSMEWGHRPALEALRQIRAHKCRPI